jgi:hypothetical protein
MLELLFSIMFYFIARHHLVVIIVLLSSILLVHCLRALDLHCAVLVLLQHHACALVFIMLDIIMHTRYHLVHSLCIHIVIVLLLFVLIVLYLVSL